MGLEHLALSLLTAQLAAVLRSDECPLDAAWIRSSMDEVSQDVEILSDMLMFDDDYAQPIPDVTSMLTQVIVEPLKMLEK